MSFRYLGIPFASRKLKIIDYAPLMDNLVKKIKVQSKTTLSYVRKVQLIVSLLQKVEYHWMFILPLLCGIIEHIYSICRSFMWTIKHPSIVWIEMCKSKEEGGFGLRDLKAQNLALLSKVLWHIHEKHNTLWIICVHHAYLRDVEL